MVAPLFTEPERLRRMHQVLVMLYQERRSQIQIATALNLSPATINRLVREGHERGLVEITVLPLPGTGAALASRLKRVGGLAHAAVVQSPSTDPAIVLRAVAEQAAPTLLEALRDGMTIAVSGGIGMCALIEALAPKRAYDVEIVPATGCVQGKFRTDVNHVSVALAEKLGGRARQLHAPAFAATPQERASLMAVSSVRMILDRARAADIAVFGIGSVDEHSTYLTLREGVTRDDLMTAGARGELLAQLFDGLGAACDHILNRCVVSLSLPELAAIPRRIAIASGAPKAAPIAAVLRSGGVETLVTDSATAEAVLALMKDTVNAET